jgi:hypothetical protein
MGEAMPTSEPLLGVTVTVTGLVGVGGGVC